MNHFLSRLLRPTAFLIFSLAIYGNSYSQSWKKEVSKAKEFENSEQPDSALYYYQKAYSLLKKDSSGTITQARIAFALAETHLRLGNLENAEPLYVQAKKFYDKRPQSRDTMFVLLMSKLVRIYLDALNFEVAEKLAVENIQFVEKKYGKENLMYAQVLVNLASLYLTNRDFSSAEPAAIQAKEAAEKYSGKKDPLYAIATMNLGAVYYSTNRFSLAEPLYLEARQIWEAITGKEHDQYARVTNNLGILYTDMGLYEKAEPFTLEAKDIMAKLAGKQSIDYANTSLNLAMIYWNLNKIAPAHALYLEAFNSQYDYYANRVFNFTSEEEKYYLLRDFYGYSGDFFSFNTLAYPHNSQGDAYQVSLAMRNLILSSIVQLRQGIYISGDSGLIENYERWMEMKESLAALYSEPGSDLAHVKSVEEEANSLEKELIRNSSAFKSAREKGQVDWRKIQNSLNADEAAIEFVDFQFFNGKNWGDSVLYIALLLRKDQAEPVLIPLFEENELIAFFNAHKTITSVYRGLKPEASGTRTDSSLYNLLWKPLEKHLQGIGKIYFAPSGLLHKLSFAAIPLTKDSLLSDKYNLVQLNTTASVADKSDAAFSVNDKIRLYGAINYSIPQTAGNTNKGQGNNASEGPWKYLKGTQSEIEKIAGLAKTNNFSVTSYTGNAATEASIKSLTGNNSIEILHIASHGFFYPEPEEGEERSLSVKNSFEQSPNPMLRSGLLFAGANHAWKGLKVKTKEDGVLTAYEVSNLYFPNTKLVVLSACETGLGDIESQEGVFGLQRAFIAAGADNLIMSLWKVPDTETAEFMTALYGNLFLKQSISEAYYKALQTMKTKYKNDPYKWAAWVLVR